MTPDEEAKLGFIQAFFDEAAERHAYLLELVQAERDREAFTLCLTYIDSFAQWLCWPSRQSGRNFVEALISFGGDPTLAIVHPQHLIAVFAGMAISWQALSLRIASLFPGPPYEAQDRQAFLTRLGTILSKSELAQVEGEVWRGTFAAIAYYRLRNPSVHSFGAPGAIAFSQTTHNGSVVQDMSFQQLHNACAGMIAEARHRSEANIQWFGDDAIIS